MSNIIRSNSPILKPWTQQPQAPIEIDWAKYPTLECVVFPRNNETVIIDRSGKIHKNTTGTKVFNKHGGGISVSGTSHVASTNFPKFPNNASTLVVVGFGSSNGMILSTGSYRHCISISYGNILSGLDSYIGMANGGTSTTQPFIYVSAYNGTTSTLFTNKGIFTGTGTYNASIDSVIVYDRFDGGDKWTGTLNLGLVFSSYDLSLAKSLFNNPWQIFKPIPTRKWGPV